MVPNEYEYTHTLLSFWDEFDVSELCLIFLAVPAVVPCGVAVHG